MVTFCSGWMPDWLIEAVIYPSSAMLKDAASRKLMGASLLHHVPVVSHVPIQQVLPNTCYVPGSALGTGVQSQIYGTVPGLLRLTDRSVRDDRGPWWPPSRGKEPQVCGSTKRGKKGR